jgi:hypothetical protein
MTVRARVRVRVGIGKWQFCRVNLSCCPLSSVGPEIKRALVHYKNSIEEGLAQFRLEAKGPAKEEALAKFLEASLLEGMQDWVGALQEKYSTFAQRLRKENDEHKQKYAKIDGSLKVFDKNIYRRPEGRNVCTDKNTDEIYDKLSFRHVFSYTAYPNPRQGEAGHLREQNGSPGGHSETKPRAIDLRTTAAQPAGTNNAERIAAYTTQVHCIFEVLIGPCDLISGWSISLEALEKEKAGLIEKHATDMKRKDEEVKTLRGKFDEARKESVNETRNTSKEVMAAERKNMGPPALALTIELT